MEYYGILFTAATILKIALYETCNVSYKNIYWPCHTDLTFLAFFNLDKLLKNPSSQFNISWAPLYLLSKVKSEKIFLASVWFIYVIIWVTISPKHLQKSHYTQHEKHESKTWKHSCIRFLITTASLVML